MDLQYIYHSCFVAETDELLLVFDYWKDNRQGWLHQRLSSTRKRVYVIASHFHEDHFQPEILQWSNGAGVSPYRLLSYDIVKKRRVDAGGLKAVLRPGMLYEDELLKVIPFRSTDIGVSVAVTFPDGTSLFHAGDLNNWYFPDNSGNLKISPKEMEGLFLSIVREVHRSLGQVDDLMFPVDPRLGTEMVRGLRQWLRIIPTKRVFPMHCWEEYETVSAAIEVLKEEFPEVRFFLA